MKQKNINLIKFGINMDNIREAQLMNVVNDIKNYINERCGECFIEAPIGVIKKEDLE